MRLRALILIAYLFSNSVFSAELETEFSAHAHEKHVQEFYKGAEPFDHAGAYVIVIESDEEDKVAAKKAVQDLFNQFKNKTYRSKTKAQKNEIYFKLEKLLPAGTVFRIISAKDVETGDTEIEIETKKPLDKASVLSQSSIISLEDSPVYGYISPVKRPPDTSTISLPDGWTKESGFSYAQGILDSGIEATKVSVVFANPGNETKYWEDKSFAAVIKGLMQEVRGHIYGLGYSDDELAWWTQDLTSDQLLFVYQNELVINLVPRAE